MMIYSREDYNKALHYFKHHGRTLDYHLVKNIAEDCKSEVMDALLSFQNEDGGFGNALEPDLRLPNSSAIATEVAINIMTSLAIEDLDIFNPIIDYLEKTFNHEKGYWVACPPEVDKHPRAEWWNFSNVDNFGKYNPSATLVGFIYKYRKDTHVIEIKNHVDHIIQYIKSDKEEAIEEHELFCLQRFLTYMPKKIQESCQPFINQAIESVVEKDASK